MYVAWFPGFASWVASFSLSHVYVFASRSGLSFCLFDLFSLTCAEHCIEFVDSE